MKLIIAEKPSVAREISVVVGASEKHSIGKITYYDGNGYRVTSARGHFVRLAEPQEYDEKYSKWRIEDLPIIPNPLKLMPIKECEDELLALGKLMNSSEIDRIICATDAGREGELIFRYIYLYVKCKKPYYRLWISSLTAESIKNGMDNMLNGSEKDNLYRAGTARAITDWLIGMNLSRLYSIYYGTKYSIGRVQTATLKMIVERDREIKHFVKKPFYKIYLDNGAEWLDDNSNSIDSKSAAEEIKLKCSGKRATVVKSDTKRKTENRPLLFSLTSLQRVANDVLGFSAAQTLTIAQRLYEKKLITYPRTDSNYLSDDMKETIAKIVMELSSVYKERVEKLINKGLNIDKRVIDNNKVTDHHAIIPTKEISKAYNGNLNQEENAIINLIVEQFLLVFEDVYIYDEKTLVFSVENNNFQLVERVDVQLGWKAFTKEKSEKSNINLSIQKGYEINNSIEIKNIIIKESETKPQKHFTESTLLAAMEHIDRRLEDKSLRQYVKDSGLGTPATRASIIEKILKLGYVEREKKNIKSTDRGRELISAIPEIIKNVEMTANMESMLSDIESGSVDSKTAFQQTINLINEVIEIESKKEHNSAIHSHMNKVCLGKCPKCGGNVFEGKKNYYCENFNKSCIFSVWKDDYFWTSKNKKLTPTIMKALLTKEKVRISDFYSAKSSKTYSALVSFSDRKDKNGKDKIGFKMEF